MNIVGLVCLVSSVGITTPYGPGIRNHVGGGEIFLTGPDIPRGPPSRGELSYLAPLGSENISAPYFKQCFFRGEGAITPPPDSQTPRLPVPRQK